MRAGRDDLYRMIENFIFIEDAPEPADLIFVPGNGYPQMAERAALLYREGFSKKICVSGRYSITAPSFAGPLSKTDLYPGPYRTEAAFLTDVLIKNGVPREAILADHRATFTYENAIFSKELTDRAKLSVKTAILVTKVLHARRSLLYYQTVFEGTRFLLCPADPEGISRANWRDSHSSIDAVLGEVSRFTHQESLMMTPPAH